MFDREMKNKNAKTDAQTSGLHIPSRQLSGIVAILILLVFCFFVGGYFLGQKNVLSSFSHSIEQESFSDQIYSSMCALCDNGEAEETTDNDESTNDADDLAPEQSDDDSIPTIQTTNNDADKTQINATDTTSQSVVASVDVEDNENNTVQENVTEAQYYAQLIGFGSARTAQRFAQKLSRKEIPVVVKERKSRTARGRFISWYQVVTEKFDDRQELETLIARLEKEEKITGVQIATC